MIASHKPRRAVARKYYLSLEAVALLEKASETTTYPMSMVLDMLIKEKYGEQPYGGSPAERARPGEYLGEVAKGLIDERPTSPPQQTKATINSGKKEFKLDPGSF